MTSRRPTVDLAAALADGLTAPADNTLSADNAPATAAATTRHTALSATEPDAPAAASGERRARGDRPSRTRAAKPPRPTAQELATPVRQQIARVALKVDVPADLLLLQRLHRRHLDTGELIRDQVAIAVDEWLTADGY
jgi:hypothetical protein